MSLQPTDEFLSFRQVCREYGLAPVTLRDARDSGQLPVYRIAKRRLWVTRRELLAWIESTRVASSPHNISHRSAS